MSFFSCRTAKNLAARGRSPVLTRSWLAQVVSVLTLYCSRVFWGRNTWNQCGVFFAVSQGCGRPFVRYFFVIDTYATSPLSNSEHNREKNENRCTRCRCVDNGRLGQRLLERGGGALVSNKQKCCQFRLSYIYFSAFSRIHVVVVFVFYRFFVVFLPLAFTTHKQVSWPSMCRHWKPQTKVSGKGLRDTPNALRC